VGQWCETGVTGASRGELGGVGGLLDRRCSCLGGFVEYTTCSEEHIHTTLCNGIPWAVNSVSASFMAWGRVSGVLGSVHVLDEAQVVVSKVVAAGNVAVVGDDVAVAFSGSKCGMGDRGTSWGVLGGVGRLLGLCWEWCSWQGSSVEQTTQSDECVCA
jgi:hypothetical protein